MSENLPKQQNTEEVDLGQLFSYIERVFKKIGNLFLLLFGALKFFIKKLALIILFLLSTLKKHFIKIGIAGVLAYALFYYLDKTSEPLYQSNIIVKQNYNTGKLLYNNISRFDLLASEGDSIGLGKQLGIAPEKAAKLTRFEISDYLNQNDLLKEYYGYITDVDSTLKIPFADYSMQYDLENYDLQVIYVASKSVDSFDDLSKAIINSIEENEYFKVEKEREIGLIQDQIRTHQEILVKSDTLQGQYINLLEKYYGAQESEDSRETTLNINMSNNKERIDTKEYSLFEEQNRIKMQIVQLRNLIKTKEKVIRLQKDFTPPVRIENQFSGNKNKAALIIMALALLLFALREFGIFSLIDQYGNKENLLDNK